MNLTPQKYTSTGTGANQVINIPYRLVAGQYAAPGNYTASHTMTINFLIKKDPEDLFLLRN